jgi:hypothetical protein
LSINWTTDSFGGNLAEVIVAISNNKVHSGGYRRHLVAKNRNLFVSNRLGDGIVTYIAKRPKVWLTLKGEGVHDLQRVVYIKDAFGVVGDLDIFYTNVMSYAVVKYVLAGLITGKFTIRWLYGDRNDEFFILLASSEFASLLQYFEQFVGYENYFLYSPI